MNFCILYYDRAYYFQLSSQFWFFRAKKFTTQYRRLKEKLSTVDTDVAVVQYCLSRRLSLRTGDIIRLSNTRAGDPLTLSVGNRQKFLPPGVIGKNGGTSHGKLKQAESEEFEELSVEGDESYGMVPFSRRNRCFIIW